jgi:hypothetical protein
VKPLVLQHVLDPEREFQRELARVHGSDNEPEHERARRKALAEIIERAHATWRKQRTSNGRAWHS